MITLTGPRGRITRLHWVDNNRHLLSSSEDGMVRAACTHYRPFWLVVRLDCWGHGGVPAEPEGRRMRQLAAAVLPAQACCVWRSGSAHTCPPALPGACLQVRRWDVETGKVLQEAHLHDKQISDMQVRPRGGGAAAAAAVAAAAAAAAAWEVRPGC